MIKLNNVLLLSVLLLTLTACVGGSSAGISEEAKKDSLEKISNYASNSSVKPLKQDYINVGVNREDLAKVDIDELNTLVASKNSTEVDSEEELQVLAQSIMDKTPPVITLNKDATINIALNSTYKDAGATARDNKDGDIPVKSVNNVNMHVIGNYKVIYTAVDKVGNEATKIRTVKVIADTIPPVITITTPSTIKEGEDLSPSATTDDGSPVTYGGKTITSSTLPGTYTITYNSKDSLGNTANEIKRNVTVQALTISELLTASSESRKDVTYIAVGDSTRNHPGTNQSFVNIYYPNQLPRIGVSFEHTAMSGQRAEYWLNGNKDGNKFIYSQTMAKIPTDYVLQRNYILEFSLGINDTKSNNKTQLIKIIEDSIKALRRDRPYIKILLVTPVPYNRSDFYATSNELKAIYRTLAGKYNLEIVYSQDVLQDKLGNSTYYVDAIHPNVLGSKILFNHIFSEISTSDIYNLVKRQ